MSIHEPACRHYGTAARHTARDCDCEHVASEIEQTAEFGSSPEGEPQWRREHVDTLRQWAKRLRGEA